MKNFLIVSLLTVFSASSFALTPVIVKCYRGPWTDIIWDRPEAVFIDTLMANGYSVTTATNIGNRVCRDINLVGDRAGLVETTRYLMSVTPRDAY